MRKMKEWFTIMAGLLLCLGMVESGIADEAGGEGMQAKEGSVGKVRLQLYRPPSRGAPAARIGTGARGYTGDNPLPVVTVLAPSQLAVSADAQPSLYWYVSDAHPAHIEVTISEDDVAEPLLELDLGAPEHAGIYHLDLADHDLELEPGKNYHWFVALVVDPEVRSQDHGMGSVLTVEPSAEVVVEGESALEQGMRLAEAGLWYDAIDALSRGIAEHPDDAKLHETRAALLDQVGLEAAADYDRQQ